MSAGYDGTRLDGESAGAITGVRIEQMLRAFTAGKEAATGVVEIPRYRLQFAGRNAAEIQHSLTGGGSIRLRDGKITLFDLLGSIEAKLKRTPGAEEGKQGTTGFVEFGSRFDVGGGRITFSDLNLRDASSTVTGQGYVAFDHTLSFDLVMDMSADLAARLAGKPALAGQRLRVPVKVHGTMESPKVSPDVGGMAKAAATEKARGLLDSLRRKRGASPSQ